MDNKLGTAADKLVQSLDKIQHTVTNFGVVLAGSALSSLSKFKSFTSTFSDMSRVIKKDVIFWAGRFRDTMLEAVKTVNSFITELRNGLKPAQASRAPTATLVTIEPLLQDIDSSLTTMLPVISTSMIDLAAEIRASAANGVNVISVGLAGLDTSVLDVGNMAHNVLNSLGDEIGNHFDSLITEVSSLGNEIIRRMGEGGFGGGRGGGSSGGFPIAPLGGSEADRPTREASIIEGLKAVESAVLKFPTAQLDVLVDEAKKQTSDLDKAVSDHSLSVHVKDDPESRSGGAKGGKGGGILGGIGTIAKFALGATGIAGLVGGALSPGMLEQMGLAFKDLTATVGVAFEPIMRVAAGTLRQIAHAVFPLFLNMRPMLDQLARAFGRLLVPIVKVGATLLEAFLPLLEPIISSLDGLAEVLTYLTSVVVAFAEVIKELTTGLFDPKKLNAIVSGWAHVGQQLVLAVALIAKKLGADGFVGKMIQAAEDSLKPQMGGAVAGAAPTITSLESIVNTMATNAAKAGGFGGPSPEEEAKAREEERRRIAEETLDALREIQKKGETDTLLPQVRDAAVAIADTIRKFYDAWVALTRLPNSGTVGDAQAGAINSFNRRAEGHLTRGAEGTVLGEVGADFGREMGLGGGALGGFLRGIFGI